ncbi:hypothetical protein ACFWIQ_20395 [Kitasatospora sp. NPDC127059]|uniref:hypothetical protein n=1 Tax=unclassified Kitasatospora TaxID=2633591 RepID=UPI00365CA4DE
MPLVATGPIVGPAALGRHGVGAFNVIQPEHAEAIVAGAERARLDARRDLVDARRYLGAGRDSVAAEVTRLLGVLRAA